MAKSNMSIKNAELIVHLGWLKEERRLPQNVLLDINIAFKNPPTACVSDTLEDTVCYKTLVENIRQEVRTKEYSLIEHLTYEIYSFVKSNLNDIEKIEVHVTKFPQVSGFKGGVTFSYTSDIMQ